MNSPFLNKCFLLWPLEALTAQQEQAPAPDLVSKYVSYQEEQGSLVLSGSRSGMGKDRVSLGRVCSTQQGCTQTDGDTLKAHRRGSAEGRIG